MDYPQRQQFVDSLFSMFIQTGTKTVDDLEKNWFDNAIVIIKSLHGVDDIVHQTLSQTMQLLWKYNKERKKQTS